MSMSAGGGSGGGGGGGGADMMDENGVMILRWWCYDGTRKRDGTGRDKARQDRTENGRNGTGRGMREKYVCVCCVTDKTETSWNVSGDRRQPTDDRGDEI